ncbi:MAG: hypothetical protein ACM3PT_07630 [Deltaproteobacteria bacterium]
MEIFDKKLKEKINKYNSTVDPELIWAGIQQKRQKDKKKRRFPFLLAACILLLVGIPLAINFESIIMKKNENISFKNPKSINPNPSVKNHGSKPENYRTNQVVATAKPDPEINIIDDRPANNSHKKIANYSSNLNSFPESKNLLSGISQKENTAELQKTIDANDSGNKNKGIRYADNPPEKIIIPLYQTDKSVKHVALRPPVISYEHKKKPNKKSIYISLDAAPYFAYRQVKPMNESSSVFSERIKNHEKFLESFEINFLIRKPLFRNLYLGTGLAYSQTDWKLDYTYYSTESFEDNNALSKIVINRPGDTIRYYSQKMVNGNFEIKEKIYNYNRMIKLPLILGYNGRIGNIDFDVFTGINFGLFDYSRGRMITPEGKTIGIKDNENTLVNKNLLQNISVAISLTKKLGENFYFDFGPQFKYGFNSYSGSSGIISNENSLGFKLGLRYKI